MPAIFRTDSGIFGDVQASNMIVTGDIKVGESQQPINQYITQEINTTVGGGVDYNTEITTLSGNINTISGNLNSLSGVVDGLNVGGGTDLTDISGSLNTVSGKVDTISGNLNSLTSIVNTATGDINEISGVVQNLNASSSTYGDSDVATYLDGNLDSHIIPNTNSTYDIGSAEYKIRHLYLSDNSIYIGGASGESGTQISAAPNGSIIFPSGVNIPGSLSFIPGEIPLNQNSVGIQGQMAFDDQNIYICVQENLWKRASLLDF